MSTYEELTNLIVQRLQLQERIKVQEEAHDSAGAEGKAEALQALEESKEALVNLVSTEEVLKRELFGTKAEVPKDEEPEVEAVPTSTEPPNCSFSFKLEKPQKFKQGDNFTSFCEDFLEHVELTRMKDDNMYLYFTTLLDANTKKKLRKVELTDAQKKDPVKFIPVYRKRMLPPHEAENLQMDFSDLMQKRAESIEDFATRVEDIASLAFAEESEKAVNVACFSAFVEGLTDMDLRVRLREGTIRNFQNAKDEACRLYGIREAEKKRGSRESAARDIDPEFEVLQIQDRQARQKTYNDEGRTPQGNSRSNGHPEDLQPSYRRKPAFQDRRGNGRQGKLDQQSRGPSRSDPIICHNCNQPNHYSRNCLQPLNY